MNYLLSPFVMLAGFERCYAKDFGDYPKKSAAREITCKIICFLGLMKIVRLLYQNGTENSDCRGVYLDALPKVNKTQLTRQL